MQVTVHCAYFLDSGLRRKDVVGAWVPTPPDITEPGTKRWTFDWLVGLPEGAGEQGAAREVGIHVVGGLAPLGYGPDDQ